MNIALPILLLALGGMTFWVLAESNIKWYLKTFCITAFCLFTVIFWSTIHTFLGWPANEQDMPEKILIHWVIIKEPNKLLKLDGSIHILLESLDEVETNELSKFFGYRREELEPRLFRLSYSRGLHEQLEKMKGKLMSGRPVLGKLTKDGGDGLSKKGEGNSGEKGGGSESQEQEWHFHELLPSDIHRKPDQ